MTCFMNGISFYSIFVFHKLGVFLQLYKILIKQKRVMQNIFVDIDPAERIVLSGFVAVMGILIAATVVNHDDR